MSRHPTVDGAGHTVGPTASSIEGGPSSSGGRAVSSGDPPPETTPGGAPPAERQVGEVKKDLVAAALLHLPYLALRPVHSGVPPPGPPPEPWLERERQVADVKMGPPPLPGARGRPADILPDRSREAARKVGQRGWVENLVGAPGTGGGGALDTLRLYIPLKLLRYLSIVEQE